jgi:predicted metal-dependent hydrolase
MSRAPGHARTARTPTSRNSRPATAVAYTLRRSPRSRGLRVTIDPWEGVVVSVPPPTRRGWAHPEDRIEAFLRARHRWISRHIDRFERERAELDDRGGLASGGVLRYRGELHRLRIEPSGPGIARSTVTREGLDGGDELVVRIAAADRRRIEVVLADWFRERARDAIDRAIVVHGRALAVSPTGVSLRDPRTRWGSASRKGRLSFSWRLVLAPPEALETVVVHELAHLRVFGHVPKFWNLVASRRPDHRAWRRWLHDHSTELHAALGRPRRAGLGTDSLDIAPPGERDQAIA